MAMVTTCPHCVTSFNVTQDVLLSRDGRVRCGKCKQIFNGLPSLTTLEAFHQAAAAGSGLPQAAALLPSAALTRIYWPPLPGVPDIPIPPMPLEVVAAASRAYLPGDATEKMAPRPDLPAMVRAQRAFKAKQGADIRDADEPAPAPRHGARAVWAVAATLALLVLAGQALYRYRSELAAHLPAGKPYLAQLCAWAGCSVPPLQQPAALNIEASDLQVVDPARPHIVQLTATLRNRSAIDVGYPAIDLVLTDNREHPLARRVFVPSDYLPGAIAAQSAIAANAETTVRIDLDTGGLPAAGFRLNLMPATSNQLIK